MQTAPAPLAVVASHGVRLRLADGRELIDGISSWWTACHGYNHPHIRAAVEAAAGATAPRHVRRPGA
jgi:adenosylmethionine-8-amino-7-oxononanoate aminotransferase